MKYAILDGKNIRPVDDVIEWASWFEANQGIRRVAINEVGGIKVSTVFLGINHSFDDSQPLWFETMIFGGHHDQYQERYETWDEAEIGHKKAVCLAFGREQ